MADTEQTMAEIAFLNTYVDQVARAERLGWAGAYISFSSIGWRLQIAEGMTPTWEQLLKRDAEAAKAFLKDSRC